MKIKKKTTKINSKNYSPKKIGRPTKYSPEFCDMVLEVMSQGYSKEAVAGHLEISKDTLYNWEKEHKDFSDALKRGVELSRVFWEKIGIEHITHFAKSGKQLNATAWIFNMKNRFSWTDKKEVDVGEVTKKTFGFKLDVSPDFIDDNPEVPPEE